MSISPANRSNRANALRTLSVLVVALCPLEGARGGMELELERVGHWGGCSNGIQILGDRAYVPIGPRVVVLDISSPDEPAFVGHSEPLPSVIMDVFVEGPVAYAVTHRNGLHALDVSDPQDIRLLGSDVPWLYLDCVAASGDGAYAGDRNGDLRVYDVSDPTAPRFVKTLPNSECVQYMAVNDQHLYVPAPPGIVIYDISVPQMPVQVGAVPRGYRDIEHDGTWLYGFVRDRLDIWDVSDPNQPTLLGECAADGLEGDYLAVSNGYAYVGSMSAVHTMDVREPAECAYHGSVPLSSWSQGIAAIGDAVFVPNWYNGLVVFDASDPTALAEIGHYDEAVIAHGIGMHDDYVYLTGYRDDVQIIDISAPEDPTRHSQQELGMSGMHVVDDMAYVINVRPYDDQGLKIAYFNDNNDLDFVSHTPLPDGPSGIDVDGDFAYVTVFDTGLFIIDVSVPEAPVIRGSCFLDAPTPMSVAVRFPYAYVAQGFAAEWSVVDVSDPNNPFLVRTLDSCYDAAESILVADDRLYLGRLAGFDIYSLAEPDDPVLLGEFWQSGVGYVTSMVYRDDRLYIAPGLSVVDVSDPANPRLLGANIFESRLTEDFELRGRYVFAAQNSSGFSVFQINLIGDVDDDGDVDGSDLQELLGRYGSCVGDADYSEAADFDDDGCINLSDLAELLSHYGNQL